MLSAQASRPGPDSVDADDRVGSRGLRTSVTLSDFHHSTNIPQAAEFAPIRPRSQASQSESDHAAHALKQFSAAGDYLSHANAQPQRYSIEQQQQQQQQHHHHHLSKGSFSQISTHSFPALAAADSHNGYQSAASSRPESRHLNLEDRGRTATPQLDHGTGTDTEKKEKKSANTSAANEKELRELLQRNGGRDLASIAKEVRTADKSQKAERAKQLYSMRWLQEYCKQGKGSVPRNRVYTHYAQRCGTDRVDTLNPASFGKLVRIIFPGIQTRRLGQRGESKYHYVNLVLVDENSVNSFGGAEMQDLTFNTRDFRAESVSEFDQGLSSSRMQLDTSFATYDGTFDQAQTAAPGNPRSHGLLYAHIPQGNPSYEGESSRMITQQLKFTSSTEQNLADQPLILPNIQPFLPPNTDVDLANALSAVYRTHCTSLMDAMRFVREKGFFRLFSTFGGTLTVPVTRLFTNPSLAPWIKLCDWHVYQQIIRFVSQLALQVIPGPVWNLLNRVMNELTTHISNNFSHYPNHVLQARLEPAVVFSKLLQRLLRVNETAHAAANLLLSDAMRNMMWSDWVKHVQPKRVVETELPACGYDEVANILTVQVRSLLEPLDESAFPESGTEFEAARFAPRPNTTRPPTSGDVMERWATFLKALPARFPQAQTRTLLHAINAVGSASLRDITVGQCQSFGSWWITKCWVDEMMLWLAEMGGFLDSRPSILLESPQQSPTLDNFEDASQRESRHSNDVPTGSGLGLDFSQIPNFAPSTQNGGGRNSTGPPTATFRFPAKANGKHSGLNFNIHEDDHDDSGIGMSLLSNDAFEFETHEITAR